MNPLAIIFKDTAIPFTRGSFVALILSGLLVLASIGLTATRGLNLGVDFTGGAVVQIQADDAIDVGLARTALEAAGFPEAAVQRFGAENEILVQVGSEGGNDAVGQVEAAMAEAFAGASVRSAEVVGPKVSGELFRSAGIALGAALFAIVVYIWFRFEWQFSLGAVAALAHDLILTIGIFSALQLEFSLPIVAALLTIVGYSLNDTVVVYDRVREELRRYKKMPLNELLDLAVNRTLSRTLMTSLTTLLALGSLYVLGGPVLRGFTFAMIWGVVVGTYSSIFIAAPILRLVGVTREAPAETSP